MDEHWTLQLLVSKLVTANQLFVLTSACQGQDVFASYFLLSQVFPLSLLGVRKGLALPQTGAAGKWSPTTRQANGPAHFATGSGEQESAQVRWLWAPRNFPSILHFILKKWSWPPCLLHFRMVNILLPAFSRHYAILHRNGLATEKDERENQELEHLVLRERGVVWADQSLQQRKGERNLESQETNEEGRTELRSELAPILTFSHLQYHQSSPCSRSCSSSFDLSSCLFNMEE